MHHVKRGLYNKSVLSQFAPVRPLFRAVFPPFVATPVVQINTTRDDEIGQWKGVVISRFLFLGALQGRRHFVQVARHAILILA